jgi:hypothetical protein
VALAVEPELLQHLQRAAQLLASVALAQALAG